MSESDNVQNLLTNYNNMGTRHLTTIIKNWEVKLAQYWQWDWYPSGQWVDLLNILKKIDIEKLRSITDEIKEISQDKIDEINKKVDEEDFDWKKHYPELSRDTWTEIIKLIYDWVREVQIYREMLKPNIWIEWTFEINFDTNKYICCWVEFPLDNLPEEKEFLSKF